MQGYPTSGYPTIVKNSPCYFSGEFNIASSISTYYFELKNTSKEEPISLFCPYFNWTRNFFFPDPLSTHPNTSFLIFLILPTLVVFSNYPTLAFTCDPTPIFVLVCFFIFVLYAIMRAGDITVDLRWGRFYILL